MNPRSNTLNFWFTCCTRCAALKNSSRGLCLVCRWILRRIFLSHSGRWSILQLSCSDFLGSFARASLNFFSASAFSTSSAWLADCKLEMELRRPEKLGETASVDAMLSTLHRLREHKEVAYRKEENALVEVAVQF